MRERLERLLARRRDYRQEILDLVDGAPRVVFYGCGRNQEGILEYWNSYIGRRVDFCCDGDSRKWGRSFGGAMCLSPDELIAMKDDCVVFVTIGDFGPVFRFLEGHGFPSVHHLYKYDLAASEFLPPREPDSVLQGLMECHGVLEDSRSREVFSAIVERVLGDGSDLDVMHKVCEGEQYFPPGLAMMSGQERLVDAGAFNGDTLQDFIARCAGKFDRVFCFELDEINFKALQANVDLMPERDRVSIYNLGLWDEAAEISYSIGKYQSAIGTGQAKGRVIALDEALEGQRISMIKMDIEGAELKGLRGARNIIKDQHPKLAICVYHDFRHLWEVPLYIKSLVPEYRIFLRHHTALEYETVCYAIP